MIIRSISLSNYKTLELEKFHFKDYNLVIGPNGAGKSNLVSFFKFLADLMDDGLESAIARQGGLQSILNFNNSNRSLKIEILFTQKSVSKDNIEPGMPLRIHYQLHLKFGETNNATPIETKELFIADYFVLNYGNKELEIPSLNYLDQINTRLRKSEVEAYEKFETEEVTLEFYNVEINRDNDQISYESNYPQVKNKQRNDLNTFLGLLESLFQRKIYKNSYLMVSDYHKSILDKITTIRSYDFNTKLMKASALLKSEKYLTEAGENLVVRLNSIFETMETKKQFLQLFRSFLPFISDAEVRANTSKTYSLYVQESYNQKSTPADLISDGTIGVIAIIISLYFEESNILLIEEPDKYLHPKIVRKISNAIDDVSMYKQVIITTHNTELLKYSKKENVLFVSRSKDGKSNFMYPTSDDSVREFLKNDLGIDELFVDNLLGGL